MAIPKRQLGRTGEKVSMLGLGGEGVLRTYGYEQQAYDLINRAIDLGITYCESARAYSGSESYYGKALQERRRDIFLTSKSHGRSKSEALSHLDETLKNMRTEYLDLWQVHDVRTMDDVDTIFNPGGAIEAFVEARKQGIGRFIGVTGHHNPEILRLCLDRFHFDTVLLPVNPAEPIRKSFIDLIPTAAEKGTAVIAMKIYFRGLAARLPGFRSVQPFFRFALSHPVATAVIGCDDIQQLEENVSFAEQFEIMGEEERERMTGTVARYARELMYYKP